MYALIDMAYLRPNGPQCFVNPIGQWPAKGGWQGPLVAAVGVGQRPSRRRCRPAGRIPEASSFQWFRSLILHDCPGLGDRRNWQTSYPPLFSKFKRAQRPPRDNSPVWFFSWGGPSYHPQPLFSPMSLLLGNRPTPNRVHPGQPQLLPPAPLSASRYLKRVHELECIVP